MVLILDGTPGDMGSNTGIRLLMGQAWVAISMDP